MIGMLTYLECIARAEAHLATGNVFARSKWDWCGLLVDNWLATF